MISFVWSSKYPFLAGAGGSENYTVGQIRELHRRGIPCRVLTLGHTRQSSQDEFHDIEIKILKSKEELEQLNDTIVFVTYPLNVSTHKQSYAILHCPPPTKAKPDPLFDRNAFWDKKLIATSKTASKMWKNYLGYTTKRIPVVYPFAEAEFSNVERLLNKSGKTRLLFSGRLHPEKGIYTFLAAIQMSQFDPSKFEITVTTASVHTEEGRIIHAILKNHPYIKLAPAQKTPKEMAELMAKNDVVVIPSTNLFWKETFGITSVEAQHAGCRVVASNSGGLIETDCGSVLFITADDPVVLARGIVKATELGPLTRRERILARSRFTVQQSVDALLGVIHQNLAQPKRRLPRVDEASFHSLSSHFLRSDYLQKLK